MKIVPFRRHDVLYVASTGDNAIYAIAHAGTMLHGSGKGTLVVQDTLDPSAGAAFGIALSTDDGRLRFVAVDDATNTLDIWDLGPTHNR